MKLKITRFTEYYQLPQNLRVEEYAAWHAVGKGVIYAMVKSGQIPSVRFGRLVRIPKSAIQETERRYPAPVEVEKDRAAR